jgi:hypothetical protein
MASKDLLLIGGLAIAALLLSKKKAEGSDDYNGGGSSYVAPPLITYVDIPPDNVVVSPSTPITTRPIFEYNNPSPAEIILPRPAVPVLPSVVNTPSVLYTGFQTKNGFTATGKINKTTGASSGLIPTDPTAIIYNAINKGTLTLKPRVIENLYGYNPTSDNRGGF